MSTPRILKIVCVVGQLHYSEKIRLFFYRCIFISAVEWHFWDDIRGDDFPSNM